MKKVLLVFSLFISIFLLTGCKNETTTDDIDFTEIYPNTGTYYEIFVRSFADSDNDGIGDFNGITAKLGYLKDLGINAIWLMPIHPSPTYHGYDVTDYYDVNPDYGTLEDFENLLIEADKLDIDIIIDFVINHTSINHLWFNNFLLRGPGYEDYYRYAESGDLRTIQYGSWWHPIAEIYYFGFFGPQMPDLNWSNPLVRDEMVDIAKFWLEKGVDGFRLDAVFQLEMTGEVLPEIDALESSLSLLEWFETQIEIDYPDTYIIGEAYGNFEYSNVFNGSIDATFNFSIGDMIINSIIDEYNSNYRYELIHYKEVLSSYGEDSTDAPFLKNHDQIRIAALLNSDLEKMKLAAEMLLVLPGNPFIYYGEELGMTGIKSFGPFIFDQTLRLPMHFGDEYTTTWFVDLYNNHLENVIEQSHDENSLLNTYKTMIHLRNDSLALKYGDIFAYEVISPTLQGFYRVFNYDDTHQEIVLVLHNLSSTSSTFDIENNDIIYYSNGINNYDGFIEGRSTLIIRLPDSMISNFYE